MTPRKLPLRVFSYKCFIINKDQMSSIYRIETVFAISAIFGNCYDSVWIAWKYSY